MIGCIEAIRRADVLIVGAGFFGATLAERAANGGKKTVVIDRRSHFGGNAFSYFCEETGIEIHKYGAHLFHTSNESVWKYINRFAEFNDYRHVVYTVLGGRVYSLPINLGTICQFFGRHFSPKEAASLIANQAAELGGGLPSNLEEKAISLIGRPLYEAFIKGYTAKQWQTDPRDLPEGIISRLPVRYNFNNRYFSDVYEGLPKEGYASIFHKMLSSERIQFFPGVDFFEIRPLLSNLGIKIVYTGPIDQYFNYAEGALGWRTIDFGMEVVDVGDYQGASVMNYADIDVPWTRIIEFRHFNPERKYREDKTVIAREFSRFARKGDEPYYPIDTASDRVMYRRYSERAAAEKNVFFGGRLGTYRYWDMHQAIGAALKMSETLFPA